MKLVYTVALSVILIGLAPAAFAADIGVITTSTPKLRTFDAEGNILVSNQALTASQSTDLSYPGLKYFDSTGGYQSDSFGGDFLTNTSGNEVVNVSYGDVTITDIDGNVLFDQSDLLKNGYFDVTVGDIDPNTDGNEIIFCSLGTPSRISFYHFDEVTHELSKISGFKPYPNSTGERGCSDMTVGDIDGDGVNELIVAKQKSNRTSLLDFFDSTGTKTGHIDLPQVLSGGYPSNVVDHLQLIDFDGDGLTNEFGFASGSTVYIESSDGTELLAKSAGASFDFGDINDDGVDDLVVLSKGRKGKVTTYYADGSENSFQSYLSASYKTDRFLVIGDFTDYIE